MMRFSKEAYYGVNHVDTKSCEPWVLAYDKHEVIINEYGGYEVIPYPDEVGKGYFQTRAFVCKIGIKLTITIKIKLNLFK